MPTNTTGETVSKTNLSHPMSTFVIRIWREWSIEGAIWRGNIEHLESKKRSGFQDFERMLAFLHSFGILTEGEYKNDEEKPI